MLKSFWMAQELLTTFEDEIDAISVVPSRTATGVFAVRLNGDSLLWDRKEKGGFPTPKELKQKIRDLVAPDLNLGHSDTEKRQAEKKELEVKESSREEVEIDIKLAESEAPQPTVTIHYCTGCRWLLRAAYFGQELLTTFDEGINSVTLMPSKPPDKGGRFVSFYSCSIQYSLDFPSHNVRRSPFSQYLVHRAQWKATL
jgi:selenoprotein W-related protein